MAKCFYCGANIPKGQEAYEQVNYGYGYVKSRSQSKKKMPVCSSCYSYEKED